MIELISQQNMDEEINLLDYIKMCSLDINGDATMGIRLNAQVITFTLNTIELFRKIETSHM